MLGYAGPMSSRVASGLVCLGLVALSGCGKEVGRVALNQEGSAETKLQVHAAKPLAVWVALDWEFNEPLEARYDVELVQNASVVSKAQCNPLDVSVKTNSRELSIGGKRSVKYTGKMRECTLTPTADGEATVKARLVFPKKSGAPSTRDASLVFKE